MVEYFLEVIGSEDAISMVQYTQCDMLYSVLPKIACSVK